MNFNEIFNCIPIAIQIKNNSEKSVKSYLAGAVAKCGIMLQIDMQPDYIKMLTEDLIDKYKYESIEDIVLCLKEGRQGNYGQVYNKLNMIVISEWMAKHLEKKAKARENVINQKYQSSKEPLEKIDYEIYKRRITERKASIGKLAKKDLDNYIEDVCNAMNINTDQLFSCSRKKEVADVRGLIKNYQKNYLEMTREQIKEYWDVCRDKI